MKNENKKLLEKAYRIRLKGTDLYYCPNPSRLSERGKIYFTKGNFMTLSEKTTYRITVEPSSRVGKKYSELFEKLDTVKKECIRYNKSGERITDYILFINQEDFEKEQLASND